MDATYRYAPVEPNFNSAYNIILPAAPAPTIYYPMYSSTTYVPAPDRSTAPFFRRNVSPPPRPPIFTGTGPKFNFDLYKMDEKFDDFIGYTSPTYRPTSPPSPRIVHHYPIHSSTFSPTSETETFSRLRQINDELYRTLTRSELIDQPTALPPSQHHIHHYPVSQHSYPRHRSRSHSEERPSVTEIEVPARINKARVTYKIHIPRKHQQHYRKSSRRMSPRDGYSSDGSITVDVYPSRDHDSIKQPKYHSDNQSPWLVEGKSYPYDSYSNTRTLPSTRLSQGLHYGDKTIETYERSHGDKERPSSSTQHRSPYLNPRIRSDGRPAHGSTRSHQPNDSFSSNAHSPKHDDRIWHPPSRRIPHKSPKHYEPTLGPDHDETQSEPRSERKPSPDRTKIRTTDPKMKKRIAEAESKIKSTWQPTIIGIPRSSGKESKPSTPVLTKKPTTDTPRKPKEKPIVSEPTTPTKPVVTDPRPPPDSDRSSLNDVPTKPQDHSTPKNPTDANKNNDSVEDLFDSEPPTPKPSADSPHTPVPEPDKGTKSTIDKGALVHGNDTDQKNRTPTPPSKDDQNNGKPTNGHITPPKPKKQDDQSEDDADRDENDNEVARSFDINKWLSDASKAILDPSKKGPLELPSTKSQSPPPKPKPQSPPPKPKPQSPPRRREQPRSPTPDEDLYKPPFGPKKTVPKPSSPAQAPPAPTTTTGDNDDVDDFFT